MAKAKVKLEIEALRVESFATEAAGAGHGTVHARSGEETMEGCEPVFLPITQWKTCQGADCTARTLCYYSCEGICAEPGADTVGHAAFGV